MAQLVLYGGALAISAYVTSQRFRTLVNTAVRSLWHSLYNLLNTITQSDRLNTDHERRWIEKMREIYNVCVTASGEMSENRWRILYTLIRRLRRITVIIFGFGDEFDFHAATWADIESQARIHFVNLLRDAGMVQTVNMIEGTEITEFGPNTCDYCGLTDNTSYQMECSECGRWTHADCAGFGQVSDDVLATLPFQCELHRK